MGLVQLSEDGIEVLEDLGGGDGVELAVGVVALCEEALEVAAGDLGGEGVGDDLAGALLLLDPGIAGQGDPDGAAIDVEADIDSVGVAGGDGHDVGSPAAVEVFTRPQVFCVEILVHVISVSGWCGRGQGVGGDLAQLSLGSSSLCGIFR